MAHRASVDVEIAQGNHSVAGLDETLREETHGLEILHFPLRSRDQFIQKIINGGSAYARNTYLDPEIGATWRHLYSEYLSSGLEEHYQDAVVSEDDVERLIDAGVIDRYTRLRDRMQLLLGSG